MSYSGLPLPRSEGVAEWMSDSKLKTNDENPELIAISAKSKIRQVAHNRTTMSISGDKIPFSQSPRNLDFYLDETLSLDARMRHLCRISLCRLCRTEENAYLDLCDAANKLAVSFMLSGLYCCNSIVADLSENKLNKLQRIQTDAARLVLRSPRHVRQHCCSDHFADFQ